MSHNVIIIAIVLLTCAIIGFCIVIAVKDWAENIWASIIFSVLFVALTICLFVFGDSKAKEYKEARRLNETIILDIN